MIVVPVDGYAVGTPGSVLRNRKFEIGGTVQIQVVVLPYDILAVPVVYESNLHGARKGNRVIDVEQGELAVDGVSRQIHGFVGMDVTGMPFGSDPRVGGDVFAQQPFRSGDLQCVIISHRREKAQFNGTVRTGESRSQPYPRNIVPVHVHNHIDVLHRFRARPVDQHGHVR